MIIDETKSWLESLDTAVIAVHSAFNRNPKTILTESDLKCWLFLELQSIKNKSYSVHSEVTHYPHTEIREDLATVKIQKYHFRDLSLLGAEGIKGNNQLWETHNSRQLLSKGFKHQGPAVHIELKLIRESTDKNFPNRIDFGDVDKLRNYSPVSSHKRRFVIVVCSNSILVEATKMERALLRKMNRFKNKSLNDAIDFYLLDQSTIIKYSLSNGKLVKIYSHTPPAI
jgi:hypothetical protein